MRHTQVLPILYGGLIAPYGLDPPAYRRLVVGTVAGVPGRGSTVTVHHAARSNLAMILFEGVEDRGIGRVLIGPVGMIVDRATLLLPDLLFVARGREAVFGDKYVTDPPDLIIEVLSPSSAPGPALEAAAVRAIWRSALLARRSIRPLDHDVRADGRRLPPGQGCEE